MSFTKEFIEDTQKEIDKTTPIGAKYILSFLLGYLSESCSSGRDGYSAFMEGIHSGLIEYGDAEE